MAPAWELPAKAIAKANKLSESQVITLPLGELFADSTDAAKRMQESAREVVRMIETGLKKIECIPAH